VGQRTHLTLGKKPLPLYFKTFIYESSLNYQILLQKYPHLRSFSLYFIVLNSLLSFFFSPLFFPGNLRGYEKNTAGKLRPGLGKSKKYTPAIKLSKLCVCTVLSLKLQKGYDTPCFTFWLQSNRLSTSGENVHRKTKNTEYLLLARVR